MCSHAHSIKQLLFEFYNFILHSIQLDKNSSGLKGLIIVAFVNGGKYIAYHSCDLVSDTNEVYTNTMPL